MATDSSTPATPALVAFLDAQRSQSHRELHHLIGLGRALLLQSDLRDAIGLHWRDNEAHDHFADPFHRRPDRDEQRRLHHHQHLSGDSRHR